MSNVRWWVYNAYSLPELLLSCRSVHRFRLASDNIITQRRLTSWLPPDSL